MWKLPGLTCLWCSNTVVWIWNSHRSLMFWGFAPRFYHYLDCCVAFRRWSLVGGIQSKGQVFEVIPIPGSNFLFLFPAYCCEQATATLLPSPPWWTEGSNDLWTAYKIVKDLGSMVLLEDYHPLAHEVRTEAVEQGWTACRLMEIALHVSQPDFGCWGII